MNRDCHGDYFYPVKGKWMYRCLLDSTILNVNGFLDTCPNCNREIKANRRFRRVAVRRMSQVKINAEWGWEDLPLGVARKAGLLKRPKEPR